MASELSPIDVSTIPELAQLVAEVQTTGQPRRLRRDAKDVAVLMPVSAKRPKPDRHISATDRAAFLAAAGSWKDVDTDALVDHIYTERRRGDRPPVKL